MNRSESACSICSRRAEGLRVLTADGPALCEECIRRYHAALGELLEEESRERSRSSPLIAAEEIALNLIDVLESSRAAHEDAALSAPRPKPKSRLLELVKEPEPERVAASVVILANDVDRASALHDQLRRFELFNAIEMAVTDASLAASLRERLLAVSEVPESPSRLERAARAVTDAEGGPVLVVDSNATFSDDAFQQLLALTADAGFEAAALVVQEEVATEAPRVLLDRLGRALLLTRTPLSTATNAAFALTPAFAIARPLLKTLGAAEPSPLERAEGIDLMRIVEYGHRLQCAPLP